MNTQEQGEMPDANHTVAANLRAELARERWSARQAAMALGVNPMYVTRRLAGHTPLDANDLVMFARLLNIPVTRFFADTESAPTAKGGGASVGLGSLDLPTSTVQSGRFGRVSPIVDISPMAPVVNLSDYAS